MAKVIPGGSSVTRVFPPSLGPTAAPDLWTVKYEADLTAQVAFDFKTGDAYTNIEGVRWDAGVDKGKASTLALNSNGLQITPNLDGQIKQTGSSLKHNAPRIAARLELLCPGWDALDTVCIQALTTASATLSDNDEFGLLLGTAALPPDAGAMFYTLSHTYNSGVKDSLYGCYIQNSSAGDYAATSGGSLLELTLFPGNGVSGLSSGTSFVDPLTATSGYKAYGIMPKLLSIGPAGALSLEPGNTGNTDAYVQIYASRGSSGSDYIATMTKFRILVKKRSL
jgi:hypothetical protein